MVAKSCLKQPSRTPSPTFGSFQFEPNLDASNPVAEERRKSVTFSSDGEEDVKEEVFYADEWDRSPHKVTQKLNYRDVLELMELRLALPKVVSGGRRRSDSIESTS
ncbi:uncharacterized protein LAESUDRAFT_724985 [Laetiporus sulphureus 93-53]|uniref:Uncharacterized protein n=1 Tax=Laetiporus sulphureus 93-53 TaxID=1314785 RepID=A0A165EQ23_9APHY|nr:uncharacterized protein LAESUDRAFT_724985 [Laetiporus sulphureus 93-53]KZT07528.1 hypothetical protein LAESUDRAFT_724985 [Laetiporus sulphureus 93-53]